MSTVVPDTTDVEARVRSPPPPVAVTLPSKHAAPFESSARNHDAVPVAAAVTPAGSEIVAAPDDAAPNAGSAHVTVASRVPVAVVAGSAGRVPLRIWIVPAPDPASRLSTMMSVIALRMAVVSVSMSGLLLPRDLVNEGDRPRSEERRVGKEWRCRGLRYQ